MAAAKDPEATEAKVASGKVVKYVGTADVREINSHSWKGVGVEDQDMVRWNKANKWTVSVADLSKGALAYLENDDDGFVIADAEA